MLPRFSTITSSEIPVSHRIPDHSGRKTYQWWEFFSFQTTTSTTTTTTKNTTATSNPNWIIQRETQITTYQPTNEYDLETEWTWTRSNQLQIQLRLQSSSHQIQSIHPGEMKNLSDVLHSNQDGTSHTCRAAIPCPRKQYEATARLQSLSIIKS